MIYCVIEDDQNLQQPGKVVYWLVWPDGKVKGMLARGQMFVSEPDEFSRCRGDYQMCDNILAAQQAAAAEIRPHPVMN